VGFIRDLPHKLVEAFEATLHEAADADLLLHVIDAASPHLAEQQADVERVLEEIGAAGVPQLLVFNKCDLLDPSLQPRQEADCIEVRSGVRRQRVFVSARTGQGLPRLRQAIAEVAMAHLNGATVPPSVRTSAPGSSPDTPPAMSLPPHQHA
jgi:GTP-binding protein HflX